MPSELSESESRELEAGLLRLKTQLAEGLAQSAGSVQPVDLEQSIGRLTRMDAMQNQMLAKASQAETGLRLQRVEAALLRFGNGSYGWCADCGEPIGYRRLKARPEAPFCVSCQGARERD